MDYDEHVENGSIKETEDIPIGEITTKVLDETVKEVKKLRDAYKAAKKLSDEAHALMRMAEAGLILMMNKIEKDVYIVTGVGRVRISNEMSVQTPKTREEKLAFFKWLAEKKGQEVADNYMSINANSLNSLYKELDEEANARGEVLIIDGLSAPIVRTTLSMTNA